MLVLTRKKNESILIDGGIEITVSEIRGGRVRLAIAAPREIRIERAENVQNGMVRAIALMPTRGDDARPFAVAAG